MFVGAFLRSDTSGVEGFRDALIELLEFARQRNVPLGGHAEYDFGVAVWS
jgi:hypothetical protein